MCGIAGILHFDRTQPGLTKLKLMTDVIAHRGPDGEGHWLDGPVGLGHRRLSIIDLSDRAAQPMVSSDGNMIITFNGEIYNYKELSSLLEKKNFPCQTNSDTEVILRLYQLFGIDCLDYLRGMFAFAIWDKKKNHLFLARDRVGIKPLYFLKSDKHLVFASEIKAIAATGYSTLTVNFQAFAHYLRFLAVPQPDSIFKDIQKLEPGHYLIVDTNGKVIKRAFWRLEDNLGQQHSGKEQEYIEQLDAHLKESVKYHMVADVPVSAFLSGGLDSSAVVSMMREVAPNQDIASFSTIFPGMKQYDEDKYARAVSQAKKTRHYTNTINESFLNDYDDIAWYLDEPFAISSAYATYYLSKSAASKTKVVLTGDGGDELFAGYIGYTNDAYCKHVAMGQMLALAFNVIFQLSRFSRTRDLSIRRLLTGLRRRSGSEGLCYSEQVAQNSLHAISLVFNNDFFFNILDSWENNLMAYYYNELPTTDRLLKKLYAEYKTRLVDEMLMKVDRMTMAHSLEARVPLLDHKIVEFAFNLPSNMKLHPSSDDLTTKHILKRTMEKYLPKEIIYRRKQGFNIPVQSWLQGVFLNDVAGRLHEGILLKWGIISKSGVEKLLKLQADKTHNYNNMLMLLLAFETWAGVYQTRVGSLSFS